MPDEFNTRKSHIQDSPDVQENHSLNILQIITQAGMADTAIRLGTHVLLVALILVIAWGMRQFYIQTQIESQENEYPERLQCHSDF